MIDQPPLVCPDNRETICMGSGSKMFPDWMFPDLDEHAACGETLADLFAPGSAGRTSTLHQRRPAPAPSSPTA